VPRSFQLAYLHHDCGIAILHCNLKPTNILLDDDMNAHLGDFGIASQVDDSRTTAVGHSGSDSSSVAVTGTIGYIPPVYRVCSNCSCINLWGCLYFWSSTTGDDYRQKTN